MPTIELTDEQAEELREAIHSVIADADSYMRNWLPFNPDYIECEHKKSVLSDILHLLEIC
jgi:hypothetical protein